MSGLLASLVGDAQTPAERAPSGLPPAVAPAPPLAPAAARSPAADPYRGMEMEDLHVSIGKRVYAQMDMIAMAFNTINSVFAISAAISMIPKYDYEFYSFCDYGDQGKPLFIGVQCPYLPSPVFISFVIIWTLFFVTIFAYRFHRTVDYWSNDLRFYVACDMLHNDVFIRIMAVVGVVLTFISVCGGIYFVLQNGSDASLGNLFVFFAVNMLNLKGMMGGKIRSVSGEARVEKLLPDPIFVRLPTASLGNLFGVCMSHRDALGSVYDANTVALLTHDDKVLARVGNVQQLRAAILLLMPPELK